MSGCIRAQNQLSALIWIRCGLPRKCRWPYTTAVRNTATPRTALFDTSARHWRAGLCLQAKQQQFYTVLLADDSGDGSGRWRVPAAVDCAIRRSAVQVLVVASIEDAITAGGAE